MKKLLYITNAIHGAGGLERVLSIKASYLADILNYEVHVIVLNQKNAPLFYEFSSKIILHDIAVFGNPFQYLQRYVYGIKQVVRKIQPDIISVCDDGMKGFFLPILLKKSCPIIYERHASVNLNFNTKNLNFFKKINNKNKYNLMRFCSHHFNKFIVLTEGNKLEWTSNNLAVIPNPLSFYSEKTSALTSKKVIAVGSHSFNKGYDLLLHLWKEVITKYPDWKLEIYGNIDESKEYLKLASDLKLNNNVLFLEPVINIEERYLEASIMVMTSRSEGFGMVLIEAMSCGLPCISFNCPCGPSSIIKDNKDGFLVTNGDTVAFTEKLIELIHNDEKRKLMGSAAKENVKRYLPENILPLWNELFKELTA